MKNLFIIQDNLNKASGNGIDRMSAGIESLLDQKFKVNIISFARKGHGFFSLIYDELLFFIKLIKNSNGDVYFALSPNYLKYIKLIAPKKVTICFIWDLIPYHDSETVFYYKFLAKNKELTIRRRLARFYMRLNIKIATKSNYIIVPFSVTKLDIIKKFGVSPDKIFVLNCFVDTDFFIPYDLSKSILLEKKYKKNNNKIVLFIGGFTYAKGADSIMNAFSLVLSSIQNVELWVVGRETHFNYIDLSERLSVSSNLRYFDYVDDKKLIELYNVSDILVMPSKVGFSLQILESSSCATPFICSDTKDIKEMLDDYSVCFNPNDYKIIADLILKSLLNAQYRKNQLELCARLINKYNFNNYSSNIKLIFDEIGESLESDQ